MKPFRMALPRSVDEAVTVSSDSFRKSKLLAGGTDLLAEMKETIETPELVVNLKTVPGLAEIRRTERGLEIGALVTLAAVAANDDVARGWPALVTTIQKTATPNIRNSGTIGGNLCQRPRCWYYRNETYHCSKKGGPMCFAREGENEYHSIFGNGTCCIVHPSNTAPVLIAYGARLEITGPKGSHEVPVEEFFTTPEQNVRVENVLAPNEVVTKVVLPAGSENRACAYVEAREKQSFDWALCGATVHLRRDGERVKEARIVLSAVAPVPLRRPDLEAMVAGKKIDDALIAKVCAAAPRGATPLSENGYKLQLVKATLGRAFRQAMKG